MFERFFTSLIYPWMKIQYMGYKKNQARILMYHSISDFPPEREVPYDNVPPWLFEIQMSMLIKERFNIITLSELINYMKKRLRLSEKRIISIMFFYSVCF